MTLVSLAKNPVPGGAVAGHFKSFDGTHLRFSRWTATRGPRRGTVCLFGGRGEYIEKYFEVIADLRRRGFAVATMDWRGQGGSERELANQRKGHVWDFAEYDKDLARFMKDIVLPDCPPPFVALAHSMGAHILIRNAVRPGSWFERMILTAPMIAFHDSKVGMPQGLARAYVEAATILGAGRTYIPGGTDEAWEQTDFEGNPLSSDRERWARNKAIIDAAPYLGLGSPTVAWVRAAYRSMAPMTMPDYPGSVRVPLLIFTAGKDSIVSPKAIEEFGSRLKVGSHLLFPGARHEILHEVDLVRMRFWAAFDAYLGTNEAAA